MTRNYTLIAVALGLTIVTAGCGDPKKASKENFAKSIKTAITNDPTGWSGITLDNPPCFINLGSKFPQTVQQFDRRSVSMFRREATVPRFDALVGQGFLTSQTIEEKISANNISITRQYDLTEKAREIVIQAKENYYLPYCKVAFKEVKSFLEPGQNFGMTMSAVTFTYKVEAIAGWAKDTPVQAVFPEIKKAVENAGQPIEKTTTMILTSEGWDNGASKGL
jgi:hypothetical protein